MAGEQRPMTDFDSPWKEALDVYFPTFLAFYFPLIHGFAAKPLSRRERGV
jgi:hypothetical protein